MPAPIPVRLFGEGITWFPRFSDVVVVANPYALQTTRAGERQRASAALEPAAPEPAPETEHPPKRQRVSECASASAPESRFVSVRMSGSSSQETAPETTHPPQREPDASGSVSVAAGVGEETQAIHAVNDAHLSTAMKDVSLRKTT